METSYGRRGVEGSMNRKSYHKPAILAVSKSKQAKSIQLAGVRALSVILLKSESIKKAETNN